MEPVQDLCGCWIGGGFKGVDLVLQPLNLLVEGLKVVDLFILPLKLNVLSRHQSPVRGLNRFKLTLNQIELFLLLSLCLGQVLVEAIHGSLESGFGIPKLRQLIFL